MKNKKYAYAGARGKKPVALAIAAALCSVAILGSAFAWTDFTQNKVNKFRGFVDADVTLHDEFDGADKDVFVENSGTSTIYVRVRLDEYMQAGDKIFSQNANVRDKTTWTAHTYGGTDIADCGNAGEGKFHHYYEWSMRGIDRDYTPGTPGMVYGTLGADGKVERSDKSDSDISHHTAAANTPVRMTEFIRLASQEYAGMDPADQALWDGKIMTGCWILDDSDKPENGGGWAYWSVPLKPDTATNLLLDRVTLKKDAKDDWIYRIDVKLQAVTSKDFAKWNDAASVCGYKTTAGAETLIKLWTESA